MINSIQGQCAIIMFDVTSRVTSTTVVIVCLEVQYVCREEWAHQQDCGTKADVVDPRILRYHHRNYIIIDCCWHPPCQQTNAEVCSRCCIFSDQSQEVMKIPHLYFWALQRTDHSLEYDRPCKKFVCFATPSSKTREPNWIWPLVMKLNYSKALIIIIVNHILDPSRVAHIQRVLTGNLIRVFDDCRINIVGSNNSKKGR